MVFDPFADFEALISTLEVLGLARIHIHHTIGLAAPIFTLPERLQCPYDMTVHDYYLVCPQDSMTDAQGRYCGAPDEAGCNRCLAQRPAPGGVDIAAWRRFGKVLLGGAERVFVPSHDTGQRMRRYVDKARYIHAIHEASNLNVPVVTRNAVPERPLKVVVLGALGIIKGADLLEAVALEARASRVAVEFHLLGYSYRKLRCKPLSTLEVHGPYEEAELAGLLQELGADVAWFPGSCPETYSYTLSACLKAGLPVVAPQIGAFPERLSGRERTWLFQTDPLPAEMLALLLRVRDELIQGTPGAAIESEAHAAEFDYAVGYCAELATPTPEPVATADWQHLHSLWKALTTPERESRTMEGRSTRLVRFVIRQPWAQPLLARVPHDMRTRIKQLVFGV
jgi:glycosyltransferase involved in cell wall biosynthesis